MKAGGWHVGCGCGLWWHVGCDQRVSGMQVGCSDSVVQVVVTICISPHPQLDACCSPFSWKFLLGIIIFSIQIVYAYQKSRILKSTRIHVFPKSPGLDSTLESRDNRCQEPDSADPKPDARNSPFPWIHRPLMINPWSCIILSLSSQRNICAQFQILGQQNAKRWTLLTCPAKAGIWGKCLHLAQGSGSMMQ